MLQNIIGRKREIELLEKCLTSSKPELIAVYGRRRIGKTYLVKQLLGDKGGLHNRVTRKIYLAPFDLNETELFLQSKGIVWTRHQIAECYMVMGGTPFYLNLLDKQYSLPQNIDMLFFAEGAELADEYEFLFRSLFKDSVLYRRIVEMLAKKKIGMTREDIMNALHLTFVTASGVKQNAQAGMIQSEVTLDDLFGEKA